MANKKDFTIEELKKMKEDVAKEYETIDEMLKQKEQEEEDRKKAQLALDKEARKAEVEKASEQYHKLLKAYIEDYGSYTSITPASDWFDNKFWKSFF